MELHHGLTVLDYSVIGVILLSGLLALMRGFVREMLSLAAWAGAYFLAANYYTVAEPWTRQYFKSDTGSAALAATIVFIVALIVFTLLGYLVAKLIRGRALTAIDRSLGFAFGLVRGWLIVCLIYLGATYIPWLNLEQLDKHDTAPQIEGEELLAQKNDEKTIDRTKDKDHEKPPEWLVDSKTRPAMAQGAAVLKTFIPDKAIEKTMKAYDEQSVKAHHVIDEKTDGMLGLPGHLPEKNNDAPAPEPAPVAPVTPTPDTSSKSSTSHAYDDQSRSNLDQLFGQKSKQ